MRLDRYLAEMGMGSRSELKKKIRQGDAVVDGRRICDPGYPVAADSAVIFCGSPVVYEAFVYYMLNKPAGVISATEDRRQETVLDLLKGPVRKDIFPVGRLDRDTEGLLLLTNDGELAHRLLSPGKHVDTKYFARVRGTITEETIRKFREGMYVDDSLTALPAELKVLQAEAGGITDTEVIIREGKFHQIKRMFLAAGAEVLYLKRLQMGPLILDPALEPGSYRQLTDTEIRNLKEM